VEDFFREKYTEIKLENFTLASNRVNAEIPQGSLLLLILYLFYNADLLENYENARLKINSIRFVADVNILIYKLII
jgi:hypothetical protein